MASLNIEKVHNCYKKAFNRLSEETKNQIVERFKKGESLTKISKSMIVHRTVTAIVVGNAGIATDRNNQRRLSLNENAFAEITPESAYWIGFLMADGCVHRNSVHISLARIDIEHLRKFKKFLNCAYKISEFDRNSVFKNRPGYEKKSQVCRLQFRSQKIVDDLARYGITSNKSATAKVIGLESNPHFWRGMIDGDGSVGENIHRGKWGNVSWPVITLCGSQDTIRQFIEFVNTFHPNKRNVHKEPKANVYNARYVCKTAIKIIEVLYKDAPVALERKQSKATHLLRYREENHHKPLRKPEALKGR